MSEPVNIAPVASGMRFMLHTYPGAVMHNRG
jgi:hypothetical protein